MNSKRLLAIASLIEKNDKVVDVGCDHAYLDIFLIKNKLCKSAIASDISLGALSQAKLNIEKYGLSKKIKTIISNGIQDIDSNAFDTIVISGMGTNSIIDILSNKKVDKINKIIIQSNNNLRALKIYMNKKGFKLTKEIIVFENKKYYSVYLYLRGKEFLKLSTLLVGKYTNDKNYYQYLLNKNKNIISKIPKYRILKILELIIVNSILRKYIKKS